MSLFENTFFVYTASFILKAVIKIYSHKKYSYTNLYIRKLKFSRKLSKITVKLHYTVF